MSKRKLKKTSQADKKVAKELVKRLQGRVAVYIDAANLEKSVQELGFVPPKRIRRGGYWKGDRNRWRVDYKKLYRFFKKHTNLASISFYTARFGTKSHNKFLMFLKKNGYRIVLKPIKTIKGRGRVVTCEKCGHRNKIPDERKADFDVEISVDTVNWFRSYETFVLFSGDSDFVYLIDFLRKQGKTIVVLSRRGHVAHELRTSKNIDYYQDIWKLRRELLKKS